MKVEIGKEIVILTYSMTEAPYWEYWESEGCLDTIVPADNYKKTYIFFLLKTTFTIYLIYLYKTTVLRAPLLL